jgi:hypothetical protein
MYNCSVFRWLNGPFRSVGKIPTLGVALLQRLIRFTRKSPSEQSQVIQAKLRRYLVDSGWKTPRLANDRTAYIMGLMGTGRSYLLGLIQQNIGARAEYIREYMRFHPCPTSMIYSAHATIRHASRGQALPSVSARMLESVRDRFAHLIFIYRHPLDSLLTNWVWWQIMTRDKAMVSGISEVYKNTGDFCAHLDRNFVEFESFAESTDLFWTGIWGWRFLPFQQFVEETELYLQSATLSLRLEDFMADPLKEFSKIADVMSASLDLSRLHVAAPRTKPYGFLTAKENVPRFRDFIEAVDPQTKRRIEKMGYELGS